VIGCRHRLAAGRYARSDRLRAADDDRVIQVARHHIGVRRDLMEPA
jgi:hypothetical protein